MIPDALLGPDDYHFSMTKEELFEAVVRHGKSAPNFKLEMPSSTARLLEQSPAGINPVHMSFGELFKAAGKKNTKHSKQKKKHRAQLERKIKKQKQHLQRLKENKELVRRTLDFDSETKHGRITATDVTRRLSIERMVSESPGKDSVCTQFKH